MSIILANGLPCYRTRSGVLEEPSGYLWVVETSGHLWVVETSGHLRV